MFRQICTHDYENTFYNSNIVIFFSVNSGSQSSNRLVLTGLLVILCKLKFKNVMEKQITENPWTSLF